MCPGPVVVVPASGPANPTWLAGFRTSSTGTKQVVTSHRLVAPHGEPSSPVGCGGVKGGVTRSAWPALQCPLASRSRKKRKRKPFCPSPTHSNWWLGGRRLHAWPGLCPLAHSAQLEPLQEATMPTLPAQQAHMTPTPSLLGGPEDRTGKPVLLGSPQGKAVSFLCPVSLHLPSLLRPDSR